MHISSLTEGLFSSKGMQLVFSDRNTIQRMLDVEAALARALAVEDVIPQNAVAAIISVCKADLIDADTLAKSVSSAGNIAIPLVKQLTAVVARTDAEAARYVHWGATSQDVIDSGRVLQLRDGIDLITTDLADLADALASLAHQHRATIMIGRTWLQHAQPTTLGLKIAGWLDAIMRHQDRLQELRSRVCVLQFGGATGTLASLGESGLTVATAIAKDLSLALPALPWHTHRDRMGEVATTFGLLTGTLGKIARDIALHAQTEIAELAEPLAQGRGGSSTMPHKRNPVACSAVLACAMRVPAMVSTMLTAMVQEQERALGGWQAEWDTLPEIASLTSAALNQLREVMSGLAVDAARMRSNIEITQGFVMAEAVSLALAPYVGRAVAHELIEEACHQAVESGRSLLEVLKSDPRMPKEFYSLRIEALFDPANYLGEAPAFVERVLAHHRQRKG
ncbi:MAG: 3-carboxy-cis,cis-muconate cycloisomerase [Betaproteobacteria bacterium]|nr:3-carboxy-cis,cis-muconate cycloisomerase [Betaproteobacteria bacterium]